MSAKQVQSFDFSQIASDTGALKAIFRLRDVMSEVAIPAIVKKYDKERHEADVQPLLKCVKSLEDSASDKDKYTERPVVTVEVMQMRHGGFMIDFPTVEGDTGWLVAGDRDWKKAKEENSNADVAANKGAVEPDSFDLRAYRHGFFIPSSWVGREKDALDGLVIRNLTKEDEKSGYITIADDGVITIHSQGVDVFVDKYGITIDNKRRKVFIDPAHLEGTDAQFREVSFISRTVDAVTGIVKYFSKKHRVLADEEYDVEEVDIGSGGGNVDDVNITSQTIGVVKTIANKVINFVLSLSVGSQDGSVTVTQGQGTVDLSVTPPGNGTITITDTNGTFSESFTVNQANHQTITIPSAGQGGVTSVTAKPNTFGLDINPNVGAVIAENTGVTGARLAQSGANHFFEVAGTEATHGQSKVQTKDVTITVPELEFNANGTNVANAIDNSIVCQQTSFGNNPNTYITNNYKIDKTGANCSLKLKDPDDVETALDGKFYGNQDIVIQQKRIAAGTNVTVQEVNNVITISSTAGGTTSGFDGDLNMVTSVVYDMEDFTIKSFRKILHFENGLLKTVTDGDTGIIATVEHSADTVS